MIFFRHKISVLFVCKANICRSPMAEGLMRYRIHERKLQKQFQIDSAGTRAAQPGHKPDVRVQKISAAAGVSLAGIKARQVSVKDMERSDYIVSMDASNYRRLSEMCPAEHRCKISNLMSFAPELGVDEVPDPYYGNYSGFEEVFRLIDAGVSGLLMNIHRER